MKMDCSPNNFRSDPSLPRSVSVQVFPFFWELHVGQWTLVTLGSKVTQVVDDPLQRPHNPSPSTGPPHRGQIHSCILMLYPDYLGVGDTFYLEAP